jgi:cytochrome c6
MFFYIYTKPSVMRKTVIATLAFLFIIASCTKKSAPSGGTAAIDSAEIFSKHCAHCHGPQGVKDSRTPNLQTIAISRDQMVNSITNGKDHMPAWKDKLSTAQIGAVADLIVGWHNKK